MEGEEVHDVLKDLVTQAVNTDLQDNNDALERELDDLMEVHESALNRICSMKQRLLVLVGRNDRQRREIVELNIQGNVDANRILRMEKQLLVLVGRNDRHRRKIVELRTRVRELGQARHGQRQGAKRQRVMKQKL